MIKKLKRKLIILTMLSLFLVLAVIVAGMNIVNYISVVREADQVLFFLSENHGTFPEPGGRPEHHLPPNMSPETPYESRFFSILLDTSGKVIETETTRITSVNDTTAQKYGRVALYSGRRNGFIGIFRFARYDEDANVRIIFLDCGRKMDFFQNFLLASLGMALAGYILVFVAFIFCAGWILRPISESYEKQKRFITDAGHEIKTPLTIINANVDVLEMELGENECLQDIQQQSKRLSSLTSELVLLARMEETANDLLKIEFPVSKIVSETAMPFRTLAQQQDKHVSFQIQPLLTMRGNDKAISKLVSILMDNALKYSPAGGTVTLSLNKQGRILILTVYNTTATEIKRSDLPRVFDRFFRTDPSRNSQTGGHGIGLSVAQAIVTAHDGKIQAYTHDGCSFQITASFPI